MRILYFYQYFCTPKGSYSTRAFEFARRWVNAGDQVTVITSVYDKSDLKPNGFIERMAIDGIDVRVINLRLSNKHGILHRAFTFLGFISIACWYALVLPADVVLCSSGPITIGLPGLLAKVLRRRPFVFEVRDLFVQGLREMDLVRNRLFLSFLERIERRFCLSADRVVALSPSMAAWIRDHWGTREVISITNAADNELFGTAPENHDISLPRRAVDEHWAIFSGAMGSANNCVIILNAAEILQDRGIRNIRFILIGDGSQKARLIREAEHRRLKNVLFRDLVPKEELVVWLHESSVSVLSLLRIPVFDTVSPNKLFDALSAGLPVIQTTNGWIRELLEKYDCGFTVPADEPEALADAVYEISTNKSRRELMSENARRVARELFDRDLLASQMRDVLIGAADESKRRDRGVA